MIDIALVSITSQGQITIPARFRDKLSFTPGTIIVAKIDADIYEANSSISLYIVILSYILILTLIKLIIKMK